MAGKSTREPAILRRLLSQGNRGEADLDEDFSSASNWLRNAIRDGKKRIYRQYNIGGENADDDVRSKKAKTVGACMGAAARQAHKAEQDAAAPDLRSAIPKPAAGKGKLLELVKQLEVPRAAGTPHSYGASPRRLQLRVPR